MNIKKQIAYTASKLLKENSYVNLGVGIPTLITKYVKDKQSINIHSENGFIGWKELENEPIKDLISAGGVNCSYEVGSSFFDTVTSFGISRGGHLDYTCVGALQVSQFGDIANWKTNDGIGYGMGGAMDIIHGAKNVLALMTHLDSKGNPKIVNRCSYPLTAIGRVNHIITECCIFDIDKSGLTLIAINPKYTIADIKEMTEPKFNIIHEIKEIELVDE